ncbi:MAG TPA: tetratricopeptide repeat protein [Labilithrix sp.]
MKRIVGIAVVIGALCAASRAHAQDPALERARTLFDEAGELERRGDYATAQQRLREALKIRETPHLRYALGWALENHDELVAARAEYELATRLADRTGADEVRRLATARLVELERITPVMQIRLADPAHDRVTVDDQAVAVRGDVASTQVDPGDHVLRVDRIGGSSWDQRVFVPRATTRVVDMRTVPLARTSRPRALPWVLVGTGAALALGGLGVYAWSASDASARDDKLARWCQATACTGGKFATQPETPAATQLRLSAADDASRGNTKQIVGAVLGGVGVATAGVGVYMLLHDRASGEERGVHFAASPTVGGAAGFASWTF